MKDVELYFNLGLQHILTWQALDHILFIAALCLRYQWSDWKKTLALVTAFTIGHCCTLLLSAFDIVSLPTGLTEFFIALTIIFTAVSNMFVSNSNHQNTISPIYFAALIFGLVHGLGFAYGLKSMLGKNENITARLLAFNCGIEVAQLLVASIVLTLSVIFIRILRLRFTTWLLITSAIILGLSLKMAIERNPFKKRKNETALVCIYSVDEYECYKPVAIL